MRDLREHPTSLETSTKTQVFNLEPNVAGTLAYAPFFVGLVCSIIWIVTEPNSHKFVRFHALQSLCLTVAGIAVSIVLGIIGMFLGVIGTVLSTIVSLALLAACIICMVKAWNSEMFKLPIIGDFASDKLL